ncbi:Na+/H+ antiporter NhaC family protein [Paenibacillus sp. D2_2]|uniref:Na+/H+ antiporter NhaC family protein n=1 Tax=Paenibacillus sp. D2_2 TaxID=3073092 RepID=UPI0028156D69|nr:Na+/H+ antiporter NhaC family protein [Paenibacillus sp. D2_2]WMT41245.1 Na+/H+ antiporter NhaC family protein [Paenibacillus sp. D2_2]
MIAGAVISGAFFGDKLSPLSDTTNIAPAMAETDLFSHVRHMLWDTIPAFTIAVALYALFGTHSVQGSVDTANIDMILNGIQDTFIIHPLLLLLPGTDDFPNDQETTGIADTTVGRHHWWGHFHRGTRRFHHIDG